MNRHLSPGYLACSCPASSLSIHLGHDDIGKQQIDRAGMRLCFFFRLERSLRCNYP